MNYTLKHLLSITLLVSAAALVADATTAVTPYLSYRSQNENAARELIGWTNHTHKADMDVHYGSFSITPEYTRSFNSNAIAQSLFGCYYLQDCNKLVITHAADRSEKTVSPYWFGLAHNYEGSITFEPVIQNFTADLNLYWAMDEWVQGLYFRLHAPIAWTKWDLGARFKTTATGIAPYLDSAEKFLCQRETEEIPTYTLAPLNCARFCGCLCDDSHTKTRLADIQADFGWNFLLNEDYHLGLFARVVAPTGNSPKGEWLFEPIIGNGHRWEFGGGVTSSVIMWRNKEETKHFGLYIDGNVTHLFNAKQNRVFDLKDKPLSRYMRAVKDSTLEFAPIANLTSCEMKVNVAVQADVVAMLNFTCKNWSYDLGYNFWVRSCEKFDCNTCNDCDNCTSCNTCNTCCGQCIIKNGNDDHWSLINSDNTFHENLTTGASVVITDTMVDYDGARTKGMSNKVFGHVAYSWMDREVVPYLGLGGEVEFGRNNNCDCSTTCNTNCSTDCSGCTYASLSQWGIWLKGGVSF